MYCFVKKRDWQTTFPAFAVVAGLFVLIAVAHANAAVVMVPDPQVAGELAPSPALPKPSTAASSSPSATDALEARMFPARLRGPYALSIHEGLQEMVIETNLVARGLTGLSTNASNRDELLAAIPAHLPAVGLVTSEFGSRRSPFTSKIVRHNGVDISVGYGDPVYATADGIVTHAGWRKAFGRVVVINHGYGIVTKYAHNSRLSVQPGSYVHRGDVIANAGSSGRSTGPHVHYEVWVNGRPIDPTRFMFDVPQRQSVDTFLAGTLLDRSNGLVGAFGPPSPRQLDQLAMGGEVEGVESANDAAEDGLSPVLPRPDPNDRFGLNAAILSIFALGSLLVVFMSRPKETYT